MDFFEAQARAKKRTSRLVLLFSFAVFGTIIAAYFAAVFSLNALGQTPFGRQERNHGYSALRPPSLWQPQLFGVVGLGTLAVVGLASLFKWRQFSAGGSAVAESVGARRVESQTTNFNERRLLNVVEEIAIAAGTPVPVVYVLEDEPAINAFAAGLTTNDAVVAVTRGTLEKLSRDELQGVIGHEFSHILNGDMRLNLRLTSLLFGILVLGLAGRGVLWSLRGARMSSRREKNSGGVVAAIAVIGVSLLIVGYVGYFFGRLIQSAVSRQREFLADASAVQFTRNPEGLTGALKKIGGYAFGSRLQTNKAAAIGHFFFAQSFRSGMTGLWATHPPLPERIRAIDPRFDGTMFEPPEKVDVVQESFASAGFAPTLPRVAPKKIAFNAGEIVAGAGNLTLEQFSNAESLLSNLPASLREAARSPDDAPAVLYGLLLSEDSAVQQIQRKLVSDQAGARTTAVFDLIAPTCLSLGAEYKLPLVQLAVPAMRSVSSLTLAAFLHTLDELVHADARVSTFEFALQKVLTHTLRLGHSPKSAVIQFYSFNALAGEISIVLSALSQASTRDTNEARVAFSAGTSQLKLIETQLVFEPSPFDFAQLDSALDRLALASGPIKQRTLLAAAHVVSSNGSVSVVEAELLRAIASSLDVPLPLISAA